MAYARYESSADNDLGDTVDDDNNVILLNGSRASHGVAQLMIH
jgi:hypothetical protein